jgi:uncharacterized protein
MTPDQGKPGIIGGSILTNRGTYFDYIRPDLSDIHPEDIARGLANTCRFAGQPTSFYSVAQHCVLVSYMVPPEDAFAGLMHDAAEAYVGDIPSPLKQFLPDYKVIEKRVEQAIADRFGLTLPWPDSVKHADIRALKTEREDLMPPTDIAWPLMDQYERWPWPTNPWGPDGAFRIWMDRFHQLHKVRG